MPVNGYQDLRELLSNKFKRDNGIEYNVDQIVVSTGAKQSIANVVLSCN
jgi:aspartate aminotransferase